MCLYSALGVERPLPKKKKLIPTEAKQHNEKIGRNPFSGTLSQLFLSKIHLCLIAGLNIRHRGILPLRGADPWQVQLITQMHHIIVHRLGIYCRKTGVMLLEPVVNNRAGLILILFQVLNDKFPVRVQQL